MWLRYDCDSTLSLSTFVPTPKSAQKIESIHVYCVNIKCDILNCFRFLVIYDCISFFFSFFFESYFYSGKKQFIQHTYEGNFSGVPSDFNDILPIDTT